MTGLLRLWGELQGLPGIEESTRSGGTRSGGTRSGGTRSGIPADVGETGLFSAWDMGCGEGHEGYSLACLLAKHLAPRSVKVWAHDKDLLKVSIAPNLVFQTGEIPQDFVEYMVEKDGTHRANQAIRDSILFEYHDVLNDNTFPPVNLILARDVFSFLSRDEQEKLLDEITEKLAPGGILVVGHNERLEVPGWLEVDAGGFLGYRKGE